VNNFKYIKNINDGEATILLYNQIGDSVDVNGNIIYGISGTAFANEILYLQDKCDRIKVRINSIGGSVLDGYSIVSSILNSKVVCETYIDGLAASISGVIAMAGKKVYMADYGTIMLHNPSGVDDSDVLTVVKNTLLTILTNRTKLEVSEISNMMDVETWLNASKCLEMGLIDEIVSSTKKIKMPKMSNVSDMALIYNKIITNKINMKQITNKLGISEDASEEVIVSEIEKKDSVISDVQAENEALKARLAEIEAKEIEAKEKALEDLKNKATEMVEKAIVEKKINETEKDSTIEMAVNNFEFVSNMLSKINNVKDAVKVFDVKNVKLDNEKNSWTIRDWEKKDAKGLAEIQNSNPELYTKMYNDFYKSK
jgi:ATP-dependent protease ClpP protease subunit